MIGEATKGAAGAMTAPPPPLPELGDLIERSEWLRGRPGLEAEVRRWHGALGAERHRIAGEAEELARPRLRRVPFGALFLVCIRFLWFSLVGFFRRSPPGAGGCPPDKGGVSRQKQPRAVRWSKHLVQAGGPAYVKLGQLIATAKGALPDPWTEAFAWCRDEVPALKAGVAEDVIDRELGHRRAETFESIDPAPVAAASIAQVHLARLADGTEVAVKVQRPGLRQRFEADIRALSVIALVADRLSRRARIANLPGFVELFAQLVLEELDFRLEAMNMTEVGLANEDAGLDHIRVPRPIPGLVTGRVLVMERVRGIRYTDAATVHPELDGQRIVRLAVQGVLEHALLYGVFHGDLHAGNVLIDEAGNFSLVDFGIAGRLDARPGSTWRRSCASSPKSRRRSSPPSTGPSASSTSAPSPPRSPGRYGSWPSTGSASRRSSCCSPRTCCISTGCATPSPPTSTCCRRSRPCSSTSRRSTRRRSRRS